MKNRLKSPYLPHFVLVRDNHHGHRVVQFDKPLHGLSIVQARLETTMREKNKRIDAEQLREDDNAPRAPTFVHSLYLARRIESTVTATLLAESGAAHKPSAAKTPILTYVLGGLLDVFRGQR